MIVKRNFAKCLVSICAISSKWDTCYVKYGCECVYDWGRRVSRKNGTCQAQVVGCIWDLWPGVEPRSNAQDGLLAGWLPIRALCCHWRRKPEESLSCPFREWKRWMTTKVVHLCPILNLALLLGNSYACMSLRRATRETLKGASIKRWYQHINNVLNNG